MKKIILLSLLGTVFFAGALPAKENIILKVRVQTANVRAEPDAAAAVIARVSAGSLLESSGKSGTWYKVSVIDRKGKAVNGYIHDNVVELVGGEEGDNEADLSPVSPRPQARTGRRKTFSSGGVKLIGGFSLANMKVANLELPPEISKKSKMGFLGGLGFETGGGSIVFEMDLLFSPGGTVIQGQVLGKATKITISGYGITAPLLLKVRFMPGTTPYILAGGEIGYILTQKVKVEVTGEPSQEVDVKDQINRLYYGLVFGGGIEMKTGGMNLQLEGRFNLGLSNQAKNPDPGESAKATAITILFAVKF